jgi:anti-sigma B factor antagonist
MPDPGLRDTGSRLTVVVVSDGLSVDGEIDAHTAPRLAAALAEQAEAHTVVAHVGGVTFMDSSGLRVLVEATTRATSQGGVLIISNPSAAVRRVIEISGLDGTLHLRD